MIGFLLFIRAKDIPKPAPESPFKHLEERKAAIYENLRDLQFEYRLDKLSDQDYQATKLELQKDLAQVMAETATRQGLHIGGSIQAAGQKVHEAVDGLRLIARRLAPCQLAYECDDGRLLRFRKSKKRMHCLL